MSCRAIQRHPDYERTRLPLLAPDTPRASKGLIAVGRLAVHDRRPDAASAGAAQRVACQPGEVSGVRHRRQGDSVSSRLFGAGE